MSSNRWEEVLLEQVAEEITVGYVGPMASEYVTNGIPFLRSQNVEQLVINKKDIKYISPEFHQKIRKSALSPGDVVIVRTGKPGACAVIPNWLPISNCSDLVIVRCGPNLDPRFLAYYINTLASDHVFAHLVGAVQQHFNVGSARKIKLLLPDIDEQRVIAGSLGALDNKIELNRRMNRTLESMARVMFHQWFVESKNSKDWQEQTLQQHVEAEKGLSYKGEGLSKDGGTPMHNLNSVYEGGGYKYEGIKYYTGEYKERHILNAGDIIVTNTEQGFEYLLIGYPAIVPKHFGKTGIFTHHIFRVHPLPTSPLKTHYLYFLLMDPLVREQIIGCTNGTTVNMLSKDGLQTPKFKLPPKELIDKFEQFASPIFDKMELLYEESRTLASLRDTLLPKLMRGEVRVSAL
jgi:type I restriction enzyme S subunit